MSKQKKVPRRADSGEKSSFGNRTFTVKQVAESMGLHSNTVYRWIRKGLPYTVVGRSKKLLSLQETKNWQELQKFKRPRKERVEEVLKTSAGKNQAAKKLDVNLKTLNSYIKKFNLEHYVNSRKATNRVTKKQLIKILQDTRGSIKQTMVKLQVSKSTLYKLMKEAKVDPEKYREISKGELANILYEVAGSRTEAAKKLDISYAKLKSLVKKYQLDRLFPAAKAPKRRKPQ